MNTHFVVSMAAIVFYTAFCLYIGLGVGYNKQTVSTSRGFFIGSGEGFVILYMTTAATWFSTWVFLGAAGSFYRFGIGWICAVTWQMCIMFLMGTFGPKVWRIGQSYNYTTPAELLAGYYKSEPLRYTVGGAQLAFCVPHLMAQSTGVGLAVTTLTNGIIPFWAGCVYAAVVVGIYVFWGGFKSQAWVDTVQGFMFITIIWGSVFIMLSQQEVGGLTGLFAGVEAANERLLHYLPQGWTWQNYLSFSLIQVFAGFFGPHIWQRMYAAKSGRVIQKMSGSLGPLYSFVVMFPVMLVGLAGVVLKIDVANADNLFVTAMNLLRPYWAILCLVGILAAGMSSLSSILVSCASILSVDFIQRIKPNMEAKTLRNLARGIVVGMVFMAIVLAMMEIRAIVFIMNLSASGFCQTFWPTLGVFFWKRATKHGAFWGFAAGIGVSAAFTATGYSPIGLMAGVWGFIANGVIFVLLSLMTQPKPASERAEYLAPLVKNRTLKDFVGITEI
ncbi:sodium:solute symporter [Synergistales bacterium]|nr:sodium:solute symporter [Synergistales bacterium]